jgi:hypothetical protein
LTFIFNPGFQSGSHIHPIRANSLLERSAVSLWPDFQYGQILSHLNRPTRYDQKHSFLTWATVLFLWSISVSRPAHTSSINLQSAYFSDSGWYGSAASPSRQTCPDCISGWF